MKTLRSLLMLVTVLTLVSCKGNTQNGPTTPTVKLTWTQSVGSDNPIAKNCTYRGTVSGLYSLPALNCSSGPSTTFTDSTVTRGNTYFYAVTAVDVNGAESAYSGELRVTSPKINSPSGLGTILITGLQFLNPFHRRKPIEEAWNRDHSLHAEAF